MKNKSNKEIIGGKTSKTWEEELQDYKCTGYACPHETADDHYIVDKAFIQQLLDQKEREVIDKIKYHFETMVFDATVINVPKEASEQYIDKIMEFRREQSKYLSNLKSEGK